MAKKSVTATIIAAVIFSADSNIAEATDTTQTNTQKQTDVVNTSPDVKQKQTDTLQGGDQNLEKEVSEHRPGWRDYVYFGSAVGDKNTKKNYNVPRSQGRLPTLIYSDSDVGEQTTFGEYPSSLIPLNLQKVKNKFGNKQTNYRALVFSAYIEVDAQGWWGNHFSEPEAVPADIDDGSSYGTETYHDGSGIYLTTAELYMMANLNKWTQMYISIAATQNEIGLVDAFATLGNLEKFPIFLTIGQSRMPFGTFAGGGPWIKGLTKGLFRPGHMPNITLAYDHGGLNTNLAFFMPKAENGALIQGTTDSEPVSGEHEGNFMYSIFYHGDITNTDITYGLNFGYLYNTANSGIAASKQLANGTGTGSGAVSGTALRNRQDHNSVLNFEGSIGYQDYMLFAGLTTTTKKRSYTNDKRAGAWYIQTSFSPSINILGSDKETVFSVAYNGAYNTQNMPMLVAGSAIDEISVTGVQQEVTAFVQRELFGQVYLGLEYAWMGMYDGRHSNEVTLDASIYF
ncbi:MAG TPA: LbtU family siderophore porin [Methyloprofundus sp.]|nr:LbtU family siderophore porin [Methyloprofundus sp.]HIL79451.1 LbtU family siderophore porin [Methylococcales bacterium]